MIIILCIPVSNSFLCYPSLCCSVIVSLTSWHNFLYFLPFSVNPLSQDTSIAKISNLSSAYRPSHPLNSVLFYLSTWHLLTFAEFKFVFECDDLSENIILYFLTTEVSDNYWWHQQKKINLKWRPLLIKKSLQMLNLSHSVGWKVWRCVFNGTDTHFSHLSVTFGWLNGKNFLRFSIVRSLRITEC